jgi:hypothetical protein
MTKKRKQKQEDFKWTKEEEEAFNYLASIQLKPKKRRKKKAKPRGS